MTMYEHENSTFTIPLTVTIRPAQLEDMRQLEWHGQFIHLRQLFERSYREQRLGKRHLLIADCNGAPIGRLFILLEGRNRNVANGTTHAYLYSLQVQDHLQGYGIGTRLIQTAERWLKERAFAIASIAVAKDNDRALSLYQRLGYGVVDESDGHWQYRDHRGRLHEVYEPCWILEKALS